MDEMAKRPRLNLSATHFKDSYIAEIECLQLKTKLIREVINVLMESERRENNNVRDYLEKSYRMIFDFVDKKWHHLPPEQKEAELNSRQYVQTGEPGLRDDKNDLLLEGDRRKKKLDADEIMERKNKATVEAGNLIQSYHYNNIQEFANKIGVPVKQLELLLKEHQERDTSARQTLHE